MRLAREANLMRNLYSAYIEDREFLRKPGARVLIFLDAHEVKAYIDPDLQENLIGFMVEVERAFGNAAERHKLVALRHDQILNGLLFNPELFVAMLPPHVEEMDREVAFRFDRAVNTALKTVVQAKQEIKANLDLARRLAALAREHSPDQQDQVRATLVTFFQDHAPALTAVLSDRLNTSSKRLTEILDKSRLRLLTDIDWKALGVDERTAELLRHAEPDSEKRVELRRWLSDRGYRKNSIEANFVDAAAFAYILRIREILRNAGVTSLRLVLASRARSLLQAGFEYAKSNGLRPFVRHPRLLSPAAGQAEMLDEASKIAVKTALAVWVSELRRAGESVDDVNGFAIFERPALAFLETWDTFESSVLAVETKWRANIEPSSEVREESQLAERLIDLFKNDHSVEAVLNGKLIDTIASFADASSRFLLDDKELSFLARINTTNSGARIEVTPVSATFIGPVQVENWLARPRLSETGLTEKVPLAEIAERARGKAERPLIWAVALACAGRWEQSAIFAKSALQLARLEQNIATKDEARLLLVKIQRFGANAEGPDADDALNAAGRYEYALKLLERVSDANAGRRLREKTAQLLEAALANVEIADVDMQLRHCFRELDQSTAEADGDDARSRCCALMLMICLFDARRGGTHGILKRPQFLKARERHEELVAILGSWQNQEQVETIPHRVRAMEFLGYVLLDDDFANGKVESHVAAKIPPELRGELPDLLKGIRSEKDLMAHFLEDELEMIEEYLRPFHEVELSLDPVPIPPSALASMDERIRTVLINIEVIGTKKVKTPLSPIDEVELSTIIAELSRFSAVRGREDIGRNDTFYLRSALFYTKLLRATLEPRRVRQQSFLELITDYHEICRDYPRAALPHLRLSYLGEKTKNAELERSAIDAALARVDADPYYVAVSGGSPWLQSFVRRRAAAISLRNVPGATLSWSDPPETSSQEQVEALGAAIRSLVEANERDPGARTSEAYEIERKRRANNVIFYASRLLERPGGERALYNVCSKERLARFLNKLVPTGTLEDMDDIDQLHTVGCYYTVLGQIDESERAATRIFSLVGKGRRFKGEQADASYIEVSTWLRPDRDRLN